MLMLVALCVVSVTWMSVAAVLVLARKFLAHNPPSMCAGAGDRRAWSSARPRALVGSGLTLPM
jgi:hypothetical protein